MLPTVWGVLPEASSSYQANHMAMTVFVPEKERRGRMHFFRGKEDWLTAFAVTPSTLNLKDSWPLLKQLRCALISVTI